MKIQCPYCGGVDSAPDEFAGKKIVCPVCKNKFMAPVIITPPTPNLTTPTQTRKFKCYRCNRRFEIDPEAMSIQCPHCGNKTDRTDRNRRFSDNKKYFLDRIMELEKLGISRIRWCSANDQAVCRSCKSRNGKTMTIAKAKAVLEKTFCRCDGFDQCCRCLVVPVMDKPSPPNPNSPFVVTSEIKGGNIIIHLDVRKPEK